MQMSRSARLVFLLTALAAASIAAAFSATASKAASCAVPQNPHAQEVALLTAAQQRGWTITAAGQAFLAGRSPAGTAAPDGSLTGASTLAIAPAGRAANLNPLRAAAAAVASRTTQAAHRVHRTAAYTYVFMNCGIGQQANVTFYVVPGSIANVRWNLVNLQTGANQNKNSGSNFCPPNSGGCLENFYLKPAAPWYVFAAEEWGSTADPEPVVAYCGG